MSNADSDEPEFEPLTAEVEVNPPETFARALFEYALDRHATDIFISDDTDATVIRIRQLGRLHVVRRMTREFGRRLQNHVRALANADVADHHHPASGRSLVQLDDYRFMDLRIHSVPCLFGQDLAVRIFEHGRSSSRLTHLGMLDDELDEVRRLLDAPSGLILVAGPTGSGKTHSLYAFLDYLNNGHRRIHTLEEPIEFIMPGIVQSQVSQRAGLDFADLLYAVLRHSPDVIMIGEIRDERTAEIAIRAANSGQLVLSTIHAQNAPGAIQSMLAYHIHPQFLSSTLLGVVSQRLVRRLCPHCRKAVDLPPDTQLLAETRSRYKNLNKPRLHLPNGCQHCNHEGYDRLICIPEILMGSPRLRAAIAESYSQQEITKLADQLGIRTLREACRIRVALGMVSAEDVYPLLPARIEPTLGRVTVLPEPPLPTLGENEQPSRLSVVVEPQNESSSTASDTSAEPQQTQSDVASH